MAEKPTIYISQVIADLKNGVTRLTSDAGYTPEKKSIQEKYELNATQVKALFKHPKLAGLRTILPKEEPFVLVDDVETSGFGLPTPAAIERLESTEADTSINSTGMMAPEPMLSDNF